MLKKRLFVAITVTIAIYTNNQLSQTDFPIMNLSNPFYRLIGISPRTQSHTHVHCTSEIIDYWKTYFVR